MKPKHDIKIELCLPIPDGDWSYFNDVEILPKVLETSTRSILSHNYICEFKKKGKYPLHSIKQWQYDEDLYTLCSETYTQRRIPYVQCAFPFL
jgi:hypothetical protein